MLFSRFPIADAGVAATLLQIVHRWLPPAPAAGDAVGNMVDDIFPSTTPGEWHIVLT